MSPEQARGRDVDRRTDIWAFGCVLFECLTGKKAFPGEDSTETLAGIITGDPDWALLPDDLPPNVPLFTEPPGVSSVDWTDDDWILFNGG